MAAGDAAAALAAWPRRRPAAAPLLLVLAVHLLATWWWLTSSATFAWRDDAVAAPALREFIIVPVLLPARPAPAAAPNARPPAPARAPARAAAGAAAGAESRAITVAPAPALDSAEAAPASDVRAPADPFAAPADPSGESTASRARSAAGAADHALRGGKLAPLTSPDTPWNRFVSGVEGARNDTSRTLVSDSYTALDGTVIYRFRLNGKVWCRTGGQVRPRIGGAEGGGADLFDTRGGDGAAGAIPCPSSAEFKPD